MTFNNKGCILNVTEALQALLVSILDQNDLQRAKLRCISASLLHKLKC